MISETEARRSSCHDLRAVQSIHPGDEGGIALEVDAGAEPCQLLNMHEAIVENSLPHPGESLFAMHMRAIS